MTVLLLDDELDELNQAGPPAGELGGLVNHTTTYIFDISNLEKPVNTGYYQSPEQSIDHNQYVRSHTSFSSKVNTNSFIDSRRSLLPVQLCIRPSHH
jgi:hypothetical protein